MKKILSLALMCAVMAGCSAYEISQGEFSGIMGSWAFKNDAAGSAVLTFKRDGTYELDTNGDGLKDIWGQFDHSSSRLYLVDTGGMFEKKCAQPGAYSYSRSFFRLGSTLTFTLLGDQCEPRRVALEQEWVRASSKKKDE